ncbi:hypothetical protein [Aeromicrobium chenweiae]|uniref:Uncharacterized protein n=1 Tax=Aeromicrobium chenweiae TaxID=2079793 RepID=A0A2S0WPQ0_9ACTN|nr:hypothetical protein [Aeromicrobium chenweiae]AWB93296.1 hypothetical protein C3E78_14365 [Aeromicrobium chenweiae]TGN34289.1 hypothetical protein E4L97_04400 [Aeromicrobium chenweiae]
MSGGERTSTFVRRQTRRKVALEVLSLAVPISSAVFFSGALIAGWSWRISSVVALLTAVGLFAYWAWHRSVHPADIEPPPAEDPDEAADDDDGRWDWFTVLLLVVGVIGVVVVGLVGSFVVPLLVILLFWLTSSGADVGDVAGATIAMLGVSCVLELAIVLPLCRRWNLDPEAKPRSRDEFCPKPDGS